jgi:myosin heavy subunit
MLNDEILDQALAKKNKEVDVLNERNERMKNEYEAKVKNLMNSIKTLQEKNSQMEKESHDNVRVEIIRKLKQERKDQEQVIVLLRKYIKDLSTDKEQEDLKVNKYLINYFKKNGEQRFLTYEELKIEYEELNKKYQTLKKSKGGSATTRGYLKSKEKPKKIADSEIQLLVVKQFKNQLDDYDIKIKALERENEDLRKQKEKMENVQKEMFDKFKNYNEEMTEMKSMYDVIKQNLQKDAVSKINEANLKIARYQQESDKQKQRIEELIKIGEEKSIKNQKDLDKLKQEKEVYIHLLNKNKEEIKVYKEELENFRGEMNKIDSRGLVKLKKLETEKDDILRDKNELEINMGNLNDNLKHKDNQINNLKNNIEALKEQLNEKDKEIEMLKGKIEEFEKIIKNNKLDPYQQNESEYDYSESHFND